MSTVRELYRLACPECGEDDRLQILVETMVDLSPDGTTEVDNPIHEWREGNYCACQACGHEATVSDFDFIEVGAP